MRHARALLPYLAAGIVIAGASIALVFGSVAPGETAASPGGATVRKTPELSATGRLAYWRQNPAGAFVLWAANFDGSSPRPLITLAPSASRPFGTRWTADGRGVGFVSDLGISVIGLDGSRFDIAVPAAVRNAGFRVVDHRWSPSGAKVAATVYRSTDGKSEVYFASRERRELARAGDLGSASVGDWINEDEVLVESTTGGLNAVREGGAARRLFDQSAASPFFDGRRIYFLVGAITGGADGGPILVNSPAVWSVAIDGKDARREDRLGLGGNVRLDGRWPDGRYLVHVGSDATQYLSGNGLVSLQGSTVLRRVVVSADRKAAVGFSGVRLIRIDLSKGPIPAENAFVVLLDGIVGADAWVPRGPVL